MKFYIIKQGNIASKSVHHSAHFFKDVETILYEIYGDCCGSVFRLRDPPWKWGKNKGVKFYDSAATGLLET